MKAKRLFISVIALCCTMVAGAQSNQSVTAILQHVENGTETVKVYVGKEAFKKAYADAVNGDAITLSSGKFDSPATFQKELSVYGAGYEEDAASGTAVTTLNGYINIKGVESLSNLHFEGLRLGNFECDIRVSRMTVFHTAVDDHIRHLLLHPLDQVVSEFTAVLHMLRKVLLCKLRSFPESDDSCEVFRTGALSAFLCASVNEALQAYTLTAEKCALPLRTIDLMGRHGHHTYRHASGDRRRFPYRIPVHTP